MMKIGWEGVVRLHSAVRALAGSGRRKQWPPAASRWVRAAAATHTRHHSGTAHGSEHSDSAWAVGADDSITEHLPMLEQLVADVGSNPSLWVAHHVSGSHAAQATRPLSGVDMLLIQHQMGQHTAMLRAMFNLGLEPGRTWAVDIPYTAQDRVVDRMVELGVPRGQIDRHQYMLAMGDYGAHQTGRVARALSRLCDNAEAGGERRSLVILDDGAYTLAALASNETLLQRTRKWLDVAAVEQTMRGVLKLQDNSALPAAARAVGMRVVNVAQTHAKKQGESPSIGRNLSSHLLHLLAGVTTSVGPPFQDIPAGSDVPVLVTGYGAIGAAVARALRASLPGCRIMVSDVNSTTIGQAVGDGFEVVDLACRRDDVELVVGCTGQRSFGHRADHFRMLAPNAVLASASSGNHEVSFDLLVEWAAASEPSVRSNAVDGAVEGDSAGMAGGRRDNSEGLVVRCTTPELLHTRGVHHTVGFDVSVGPGATNNVKHVRVLNGGFPCTFIGALNAVPALVIQPTLCLMVGGAVQAAGLLPSAKPHEQHLSYAECGSGPRAHCATSRGLAGRPRGAGRTVTGSDDLGDVLVPAGAIDAWVSGLCSQHDGL